MKTEEVVVRVFIRENIGDEFRPGEVVQRLVRCKNCEFWRHGKMFDEPYCELSATRCGEYHFCGWGEECDER